MRTARHRAIEPRLLINTDAQRVRIFTTRLVPMSGFTNSIVHALVLACLSAGGVAIAQEPADKLADIRSQQSELKRQMDAGELPLTPRQANTIRKSQAEVSELTQGAATLSDLDMGKKVRLENALERINAIVVGTRAASSGQQICKRVALAGTAMKSTRCATQAEWEQVRETSRSSLEKQRVCEPPGCG